MQMKITRRIFVDCRSSC